MAESNGSFSRKRFLKLTPAVAGGFGLMASVAGSASAHDVRRDEQQEKKLPLEADKVREFVRVGHFDFEAVKAQLEETPSLLNASWDWGNGDFETAIEGAGHMGRRDIAEFLLDRGARTNIFVSAMLGKSDIVKSTIEAFPQLVFSKGAHGISLLAHAEKGEHAELVAWLKQKEKELKS